MPKNFNIIRIASCVYFNLIYIMILLSIGYEVSDTYTIYLKNCRETLLSKEWALFTVYFALLVEREVRQLFAKGSGQQGFQNHPTNNNY